MKWESDNGFSIRVTNEIYTYLIKNPCYFVHSIYAVIQIMLHVHPLLGNGLVNNFALKQILGKQSVARLRNNSDNRRSVFDVVCTMPSSKQQNYKHVYSYRCFLWGLCRRFIGDSEGRLQSVVAEKSWVKDTKPSRNGFARIQLWSVKRHWRIYVL
jgi:hypothetical protein